MILNRRALNNGLIAGLVLIFLVLIGIPGGTGGDALPPWFTWVLFALTVGTFAFFAVRPRNIVERRESSIPKALSGGLTVGVVAAAIVVVAALAINAAQLWEIGFPRDASTLPSGMHNNIMGVQDVFHNVTERTTAVLSGLDESQVNPSMTDNRADPSLRFFLLACLLPIAGIAGGGLNWLAQRRESQAADRPLPTAAGAVRNRQINEFIALLPPLLLFVFIVFNSVNKDFLGTNAQLAGLIATFFLVGSAMLMIRGMDTANSPDVRPAPLALRLAVLIGFTLIMFGIGLLAPSRPSDDLLFSPKAPNQTQINAPDGSVQVVTETVSPIDEAALFGYRRLAILAIGALFIVANVLAARGQSSLRRLLIINILMATLFITPLYLDKYQQSVMLLIGINILLGLGLNIVVGYAGLLDLGYVAFYAIGAYVYAFLSSNQGINIGGSVVSLKFGGNDQSAANIAAALIIGLVVVPIVMGVGLWLWRRSQQNVLSSTRPLTVSPSATGGAKRPAWLGYALIVASIAITGVIIRLLIGTAFYNSFGGFPVFVIGLLLGVLCAGAAGVLLGIPVLRLRGDYLAIVTLGFGEIIRLFLNNLESVTGGPQGLLQIPKAAVGNVEMGSNEGLLYIVLIGCLLVALLSLRLKSSRLGRAWGALKSDEDIAQAMGVNIVNAKVLAFATGAAFAGVGGVIFAARQANVFPDNFTLNVSINVLALIIIGGMGSIPGVVVGALVLIGVPESLRVFESYRIMAFGALLIVMMLLRPSGLLPQPPQPMESRARSLVTKEPAL